MTASQIPNSESREYDYPTSECDVADKKTLKKYREKRSQWLLWLKGDPDHSVWVQIETMLWNDAIFRLINESRRIAHKTGEPSSALNGAFARFTDQGYVATQVLAIRRLMDKRDDVISLRRVLNDMRANKHLMTREHYVAHDGLPFDCERVAREFWAKHIEHGTLEQLPGLPSRGPEAFGMARLCHDAFDRLAGTAPANRRRGDIIADTVFSRLDDRLERSGAANVIQYGHKFIAHAADARSRQTLSNDQQGITLDKLAGCQRAICEVAHTISACLLWDSNHGLIPVPQYDLMEHLDQPWLRHDHLKTLRDAWEQNVRNVEQWTENAVESCLPSDVDED